jgi:hypothetical protein
VERPRVEQRADRMERRRVVGVVPSVDQDVTGVRAVEADDGAHRRRLARPVRAEEAGSSR